MTGAAEPIHGSCLCGAVAFSLDRRPLAMGHCHCSMCRRQHGTAFSTYAQVEAASLTLERGADRIRSFASSPGVERRFCATCGSKLFYVNDTLPGFVWVAAGAFDDDPLVRADYHIFVASKAPWHEISDDLPQHAAFPAGAEH